MAKTKELIVGKSNLGTTKAVDHCAPLTYKEHEIKVSITEPIEAKGKVSKHLFMPFFHTEMLSGTTTNSDTQEKADFSMSVAINGSALYFKHGKKWYFIKTDGLIQSILALENN